MRDGLPASGRTVPIRRCPRRAAGGRSPRSTIRKSWPPDGEKGAVLRREGLYSSLISECRRARDAGRWPG